MQQGIGYFRAYGALWRYYANFTSRTSREAFWKAFFLHSLIYLILTSPLYYIFESIIVRNDLMAGVWLLPLVAYSLATVVPTIAIIIRRLHDLDRHGCWFLLFLIPYAGVVIFFIMLSRKGAPYDVYPGRSGSGPYTGGGVAQTYAPPQDPYTQNPYAPPQDPYTQNPYAPPQNPYAQPPGPYTQNPYAQPQNPYTQPPVPYTQNPYGPPYYRPLPPPRKFAPPAGGNKAALAIILSIIVAVVSNIYGFVASDYMQKNIDRYINNLLGDGFMDIFGDFYDDPYGWGGLDPWGSVPRDESDPWSGEDFGGSLPWDSDEYLKDDPGYSRDGDMSEDETAVIDLVKESALEGFPGFTIEEVLLTKVEEGSLEWDCYSDKDLGSAAYYVSAVGIAIGDFVFVYAGFDVSDDGNIELYNLDDGDSDAYYEDALKLYGLWYEEMLSGAENTSSA